MPVYQPPPITPDGDDGTEIQVTHREPLPYRCLACNSLNTTTVGDFWSGARGRRQCNRCFAQWSTCDNDFTHAVVSVTTIQGHEACRDCLTRNGWRRCQTCQRLSDYLNIAFDESGRSVRLCTDCISNLTECYGCSTYLPESRVTRDVNDDPFCNQCTRDSLIECEMCARYRRRHTVCPCGDTQSNCDCYDCRMARRRAELRTSVGYLNEWSYRPIPNFHGEGPLFLGMELEVETGMCYDECTEVVKRFASTDICYLKADGSINSGFELVTHPMAFEWALQGFPWEMLPELDRAGARTTDQVGIHVHLSRKGFASPTHTYKWMKFIYRNSDRMTRMAGRESYQWAAFDPDDRVNVKHYAKGEQGSSRYRAINTCNAETFELRIFRSSLDPQQVKASLGLADASVKYTGELSTSDILHGGWEWRPFFEWLSDKPQYVDLRTRMEELSCVS